ncbi:unnamed protein product [Moneuplotes crassus]|uniref:Uncharacterized protein n=1 Tax=Euplotes crassus TaxID=5936 RepID=A0AAD2CZU1_EUPCR|nr:unnamed protein product [Moneuplotes crassus]
MERNNVHFEEPVNKQINFRISTGRAKTIEKINPLTFDCPPPIFDDVPNRGWLFCAQSIISTDSGFPKKVKQASFYCSKQKNIERLPYFAHKRGQKLAIKKGPFRIPQKKYVLNQTLNTISTFLVQKYKGVKIPAHIKDLASKTIESPMTRKVKHVRVKKNTALNRSIESTFRMYDRELNKSTGIRVISPSHKSSTKPIKSTRNRFFKRDESPPQCRLKIKIRGAKTRTSLRINTPSFTNKLKSKGRALSFKLGPSPRLFRRMPKNFERKNLEELKSQISDSIYNSVLKRRESSPIKIKG